MTEREQQLQRQVEQLARQRDQYREEKEKHRLLAADAMDKAAALRGELESIDREGRRLAYLEELSAAIDAVQAALDTMRHLIDGDGEELCSGD